MLNSIELNKEIYRQIAYLSDDKAYLEKALEMLRGLTLVGYSTGEELGLYPFA